MPSARKAHSKSRNGCHHCKQKRVKCDEQIPCTRCARARVACSLGPSTSPESRPSSIPRPSSSRTTPHSFTARDFHLFHHFITSTSTRLRQGQDMPLPWKAIVPTSAPDRPYLLHEMLAVAAIHLHFSAPDSVDYRRIAQDHHSQALACFRAALSSPNATKEALALFACSALMSTYYFAAFDDPSCLLFGSSTLVLPEWMLPIRGCAALLCQFRHALGQTDMEDLLKSYGHFWTDAGLPNEDCMWDRQLCVLQLRLRAIAGHNSHAHHDVALQLLRRCFVLSDQNPGLSGKAVAAMTFPSIASVDFLEAVSKQKSPGALVIMAFWCVLLGKVQDKYWLREENVPRAILQVIASHVKDEYLNLIDWPLEVLGLK